MELLKQPLYHSMPVAKQVVFLVAATSQLLLDIPKSEFKAYIERFYNFFEGTHGKLVRDIEETGQLSDDSKEIILNAVRDFKKVNLDGGDKGNT